MISGIPHSGKTTLAKFLGQHIKAEGTKLLSTDSVLKVMRKYISEEEEPIVHASAYDHGDSIGKRDDIRGSGGHRGDTVAGY